MRRATIARRRPPACRWIFPSPGHRACATPAGRSPRLRLRGTCQRERGEPIVGSQYACSKRNIGTM
ncbi:hypothetical protein C7H84_07235 [Burkholderia sp. Nafp2/4-1b]|nr:hypothetical protein C7H84_07235 [Burkholderia sp. Nafp2/4-1b]